MTDHSLLRGQMEGLALWPTSLPVPDSPHRAPGLVAQLMPTRLALQEAGSETGGDFPQVTQQNSWNLNAGHLTN